MTRRTASPPSPELLDAIEHAATGEGGWRTYECTLVTPMYGGGVQPGKVDPEMPIRASAIRGQLRFWWRVACGPFDTAENMFRRETEIWGGIGDTPTASEVGVRVECAPATPKELAPSSNETHAAIKYAFGSAAINGPRDWLQPGYRFRLMLRYPLGIAPAVESALTWWAAFGGVGARTRRGFGAVSVKRVIGDKPEQLEDMPRLDAAVVAKTVGRLQLAGTGSAKADNEWKLAVDRLYSFRQKGGTARKAGSPRPGRSYWPEPDQLRRFTRRDANGKHEPMHPAGNVFPRAAFGLPITFEFKGSPGEPPKMELHPEGDSDRMASPLILRPYWDGQKWRPAALLLPKWEDALKQPLKFKGQNNYQPVHWPTDAAQRKKLSAEIPPMAGRATDPLSAFMAFFVEGK